MTRFALALTAIGLALGGCAAGASKLPPPSGRLMAEPDRFPRMTEKDDVRAKFILAAQVHARNAQRLRDLQEWARTATQ